MRRLALSALAVVAVGAGFWFWQSRENAYAGRLIARIPSASTTTVGIDVAALRRTGLLDRIAGARDLESPEYRRFVEETGFDYRQDLDYAVAGLEDDANHFVLRGSFDWTALERYALSNGGSCVRGACSLRTDSGREASFTLAEPNVLTVTVGTHAPGSKRFAPPGGVAWAVLDRPPPSLFEGATKVTISIQAGTKGATARLQAICPDRDRRPVLAASLQSALENLRAGPLATDLSKGAVKTTDSGVEISWRLDGLRN